MENALHRRTDQSWIDALLGHGQDAAAVVGDLQAYLGRILARMVGQQFSAHDLEELVQDSLTRIVKGLGSFRGDAAFTTWAAGIASRTALTELRRRRARTTGSFDVVLDEAREPAASEPGPEDAAARSQVFDALDAAIHTRLTERQRIAVLAELRGIPTIEIADRLGTNQNALYKLTHDARKKLKVALEEAGFTAEHLRGQDDEVPR